MDINTLGIRLYSSDFGYHTNRGRPTQKASRPSSGGVSIVAKKHVDRLNKVLLSARETLIDDMMAERGLG